MILSIAIDNTGRAKNNEFRSEEDQFGLSPLLDYHPPIMTKSDLTHEKIPIQEGICYPAGERIAS